MTSAPPLDDVAPTWPSVLTIDHGALAENWRRLDALSGDAETAAVVKANAYGLGVDPVAKTFLSVGCRTFFVATLPEAIALRALLGDTVTIYALNGLTPDTEATYAANAVRPVLSSFDQTVAWADFCRKTGTKLPAAIHVDTGMSRLGFDADDLTRASADDRLSEAFDLALVMTHPACADDADDPMTREQLAAFAASRARLPSAPASFANSAAIIAHPGSQFDLVRPGIALYGGRAVNDQPNPMANVVTLHARILQIRNVPEETPVGYGATYRTRRPSRLATVATGYADGFIRGGGAAGDGRPALAYITDQPAPIVGRVSMDLIILDITDIPDEYVRVGSWVELFGSRTTIDDLADHAGTIGYEILTRLGTRCHRRHVGRPKEA